MPRSWLEALKPQGLPYYPSVQDYWRQQPNLTGTNPAGPTHGRKKLWADNEAMRALAAATPPAVVFWGSGAPPVAPPVQLPDREYTILARDAGGRVLLTPIESMPAFSTYSQTVINTYRERAHFFTGGVPYLVKVSVPVQVAAHLNFQGAEPAWDVPVVVGANHLLVPDGRGDVLVYDDEEFRLAARVPTDWTDERRLQEIDKVRADGLRLGTSAAMQISAILDLCTKRGGTVVLT